MASPSTHEPSRVALTSFSLPPSPCVSLVVCAFRFADARYTALSEVLGSSEHEQRLQLLAKRRKELQHVHAKLRDIEAATPVAKQRDRAQAKLHRLYRMRCAELKKTCDHVRAITAGAPAESRRCDVAGRSRTGLLSVALTLVSPRRRTTVRRR